MPGLCLLAWRLSLGSGLSGSLAPDTLGLVPRTSSSALPASLNRALKTTSDFTARCPTPWEVGCVSGLAQVWEPQKLARACSAQAAHKPQVLGSGWEGPGDL